MSGRRHRTPEQVVRKLHETELLLGQGVPGGRATPIGATPTTGVSDGD
jgi:hypothetical protein